MVRCLFRCNMIVEHETTFNYHFYALNNPKNGAYWETAFGNLELTISKSKGKLFEVGNDYNLDINKS